MNSLIRTCLRASRTVALAAAVLLPTSQLHGQDDFFGSIEVDVEDRDDASDDWSLLGWAIQKAGYGYQAPPAPFARQRESLNTLETSLYLQFDTSLGERTRLRASATAYHEELYRLQDDVDFSSAEVAEFRNRYDVRDLYIEHDTDAGVYFKLGNQILAWGMSEYLRVTDLVNTEDLYTFGQQDLEDLRLQVPALLTSVSLGNWSLDAVLTQQAGTDNLSPARDEFDTFITLRQPDSRIYLQDPEHEQEVFVRASTRWSQGDIQFVAAEFNDNRYSRSDFRIAADGSSEHFFGQARLRALGAAANLVSGSWLVFGEAALHQDRRVRPRQQIQRDDAAWEEKNQWLGAFGLEYSGLRNLLLSLEMDTIHTPDHDKAMLASRTQTSFGGRIVWTALNERLRAIAVWNELADSAGRVTRLSLNYDWSDSFSAGLLWVTYDSSEDSVFYPYHNNDTVQAQIRYNFQF